MQSNACAPCDPDIFQNGEHVFMTHTLPAPVVECFVRLIRLESGQRVDWHYSGGRANVLALGDIARVKAAIEKHRDVHDEMLARATRELLGGT